MKLFNRIDFPEIDPLGGGLAEEIAAEQAEPEAIELEENIEAESLRQKWEQVVRELHDDPDWFSPAREQNDH